MNGIILLGGGLLIVGIAFWAYSQWLCFREWSKIQDRIERLENEHPAVRASREVN